MDKKIIKIEFIDNEFNTVVSMSDFNHSPPDEYLVYYTINLKIKYDCFLAEKKIDIEVSEFENLYKSIERIKSNNKPDGFYLLQLDNYFEMHFTNLDVSNMKIEVTLNSSNYIGKLYFSFIMNKKEIFRLNKKIKNILI